MVPIQYNLRNLVVRKATTVATALGLASGGVRLLSVLMLSNGIKKTLGRGASDDVAIVLRKGSDTELASGIDDASVNIVLAAKELAAESSAPRGVGEGGGGHPRRQDRDRRLLQRARAGRRRRLGRLSPHGEDHPGARLRLQDRRGHRRQVDSRPLQGGQARRVRSSSRRTAR
jgi:hypothetical protein